MQYYFELSKEHKNLPRYEILTTLDSYNYSYEIILQTADILIIDIDLDDTQLKKITDRIALSHSVGQYIFSSVPRIDEIRDKLKKHPIKIQGSLAVRYKNRSKNIISKPIMKAIASFYSKNIKVDLERPDNEIFTLIGDNFIHVGLIIKKIDRKQYNDRKAQHRPFFSPISLHPKIARSLVNLSKINVDKILFDPFCGTGGFLIEAGLIGCKVIGSDIEQKMVQGTLENLEFYNIRKKIVFQSDIGNIENKLNSYVDAIVTDFPYGKATTTNKESIISLYQRALKSIHSVLKKDGRIVIGFPKISYNEFINDFFKIDYIIEIPVHKSLTRYFYIGSKN